jgi:lauroyl/myristoyl acyltransferase
MSFRSLTGREELDQALRQGRGIILTTLHASWFEAYFAWFNKSGLPTTLIYQRQNNLLSDAYFIRQRNRYGTSLEHLCSGEGIKPCEESLAANRLLIVSLDQSYRNKGTEVLFFNRPLPCAKGTAILRLRTCAPVFTSVYYMRDGRFHIDFKQVELPEYHETSEEVIKDISQRCIRLYEPFIREYPEQWFSLFHRLWSKKGYPPVKRSFRQIFL